MHPNLTLAFDEIRQYGVGSLQVMRRLRAALDALADSADEDRREVVRKEREGDDEQHERCATEAGRRGARAVARREQRHDCADRSSLWKGMSLLSGGAKN